MRVRSRMDAVQDPIIPVIGDLIRQVPGTISLGQGVVHYGPPEAALEAARAALNDPATHSYQSEAGLPALLERVGAKLRRDNGIDVAAGRRIMITAGANMAFMHAILAITEPGDEIVLPVPFYFNHDMAIQMAGCRIVTVPTDDRYQLRLDAIHRAISDHTRAIVTVSPNNPSGAVFSEASLHEVNTLCRERGLYHLTDEVYEYFTYGSARHVSPGSFANAAAHTISMYSLSKAYGFAGWRIGYMVYPEHLAVPIMKSQDTILVCPPVISQIAAAAALDVGRAYCEPHVRELAAIRDSVLAELSTLAPLARVGGADGAFYCLLTVNTRMNPLALAERLIREHRVAVVPAFAFGMTDRCAFRVAYGALQKETVAEGVGRLVNGLREILEAT
ncbi:MAG: pyridoxal phosphate-dependent aminotransferase [Acidobacteria bacterium]|nr:MAG: pyridoxal phosphate-dependent aminotransferase [Acidobacteriota bacterium]